MRRMWLVAIGMLFGTLIVVGRLFAFQVVQGEEWSERASNFSPVTDKPERGVIYDRSGAVMAVNELDYMVGASPSLVIFAEETASELAPILETSSLELLSLLTSDNPFVLLESRVSSEVADRIREMEYSAGLQLDPLPVRYYPQDKLMCHVLGYVTLEGVGGNGIEGYYQQDLAGAEASANVPNSPLLPQTTVIAREGADLVLTIDRNVQFLVERHLQEAMVEHGAVSGEIIVMDPRTGAIVAMASMPCYSPNDLFENYETLEPLLVNPLVSIQYEPGSVMKLITMAAALDSGTVTPNTTYNDTGAITVGGHTSYNWDRGAYGTVDMTTLLSKSLNVGAATIATWMGQDVFYDYFQRFNFGRPTGIDMLGESGGEMNLPGRPGFFEDYLATNSYGQGIATTPLQMTAAIAALANNGYLMQPYLVQEIHDSSGVHVHEPTVLSQVISPETAQTLTTMAVTAVNQEVPTAQVPGYTVAGKTGTAQIYEESGFYHPTDVIGSFVGWLPAEAPEIVVLVKLDRPTSAPWGSQTAAPAFAKLAKELVVLLDIPPDEIRLQADIAAARAQGE